MNQDAESPNRSIVRNVIVLQFKLLLDALRDLALSPLSIAAAVLDLLLSKQQSPRYFKRVLKIGLHSEEWIDLWSAAREDGPVRQENVDTLLARVEEIVSDPSVGARRARVLRRWAERQLARARRQVEIDEARARDASSKELSGSD
ncbi:hypothetical protein [Dokdonella sp.]|uniref:hypothetical protein n=1 Tax=Dokdonella sp. TaxID=2291710 RepID=UPI0035276B65